MKIRSHSGAHVGIDVVRDLLALALFLCGTTVLVGFHAILAIVLAEDLAGRVETEEEYRARVRPPPAPEGPR